MNTLDAMPPRVQIPNAGVVNNLAIETVKTYRDAHALESPLREIRLLREKNGVVGGWLVIQAQATHERLRSGKFVEKRTVTAHDFVQAVTDLDYANDLGPTNLFAALQAYLKAPDTQANRGLVWAYMAYASVSCALAGCDITDHLQRLPMPLVYDEPVELQL